MSEFDKKIEQISAALGCKVEAHLIESIVSLFNQGVLVRRITSPRMSIDESNFKMSVEQAQSVTFKGREKIIQLEQKLSDLKRELEKITDEKSHLEAFTQVSCERIESPCDTGHQYAFSGSDSDRILEEISDLKALCLELVEAVEFYGSPENWIKADFDYGKIIAPRMDREDISKDDRVRDCGGKFARATLSKHKDAIERLRGQK